MHETRSDIYYRMKAFLRCNCVERALITGKIAVQVDANAIRDHFGGALRLVSLFIHAVAWMYWNP